MNKLNELALELIINKSINQKAVNILMATKNSKDFFKNDLFSIFIILSSLTKNNPDNVSGNDLGQALRILAKNEVKNGGPYYEIKTKEVNADTNLAIAYFLKLNNVQLDGLNSFLNKNRKKVSSKILLNLLLKKEAAPKILPKKEEKDLIILILKNLQKRLNGLSAEFRKDSLEEVHKTLKRNTDKQMSLISYYLYRALGKNEIDKKLLVDLGLMNIFFWTAFIIYDNFWDEDEEAEARKLPVANLFARDYISFYTNIFRDCPEFNVLFQNTMDRLDMANNWETNYCRAKIIDNNFIIPKILPKYHNYDLKFYPAAGQIMGPIVILISVGYKIDSMEVRLLINYFKNYLIAMQLNDDAHDWEEDLRRGHLSTAVVVLINDWLKLYPNKREIDLQNDLEKLKEIFWQSTIKEVAQTAIKYTKKSRQALEKMPFLKQPEYLEYFINIAENVAKQALNERQKGIDLLNELKTPL
jgi:hypothetical protein